jgi:hypothetical protein
VPVLEFETPAPPTPPTADPTIVQVDVLKFDIPNTPVFPPVTVPVMLIGKFVALELMANALPAITLPVIVNAPVLETAVLTAMALLPELAFPNKFPVIFNWPPEV